MQPMLPHVLPASTWPPPARVIQALTPCNHVCVCQGCWKQMENCATAAAATGGDLRKGKKPRRVRCPLCQQEVHEAVLLQPVVV